MFGLQSLGVLHILKKEQQLLVAVLPSLWPGDGAKRLSGLLLPSTVQKTA